MRLAQVLAGFDTALAPVNPDAAIGAIKVGGNWIASSAAAGIGPGADALFGTGDDGAATPAAGFTHNAKIISRIVSIQIGGSAGTSAQPGDHFAFTAQRIGKLTVSTHTYALSKTRL